jgi:hypothetical protein
MVESQIVRFAVSWSCVTDTPHPTGVIVLSVSTIQQVCKVEPEVIHYLRPCQCRSLSNTSDGLHSIQDCHDHLPALLQLLSTQVYSYSSYLQMKNYFCE